MGPDLPWISDGGTDYNGFDEWVIGFYFKDAPAGPMLAFLGVVLLGFGIATLAAGRVLAIVIIGIVVAAFALLGTVVQLSDYSDVTDQTSASLGPGIIVSMAGAVLALGGAIAGCAKRRRW